MLTHHKGKKYDKLDRYYNLKCENLPWRDIYDK